MPEGAREGVPAASGKICAPKRSTGVFREPGAGAGRTTGGVPAEPEVRFLHQEEVGDGKQRRDPLLGRWRKGREEGGRDRG